MTRYCTLSNEFVDECFVYLTSFEFFDKLIFLNVIFVKSIHVRAREYACVSVRAGVCVYLLASIYIYNIHVNTIFFLGHVRYMETLMFKLYLEMQYNLGVKC